jgi:hypothetical protein
MAVSMSRWNTKGLLLRDLLSLLKAAKAAAKDIVGGHCWVGWVGGRLGEWGTNCRFSDRCALRGIWFD